MATDLANRFQQAAELCRQTAIHVYQPTPTADDLERIAALLTADDERIEFGQMKQRESVAYSKVRNLTGDHPHRVAWEAWWWGLHRKWPIPELRALEAAYRAALETEQG